MTELVIRIDPARTLASAYARGRAGVLDGWRYVERTWRAMHDQPVVTRLVRADRKTHVKVAMVAVAVVSIILIYGASRAITATPPPRHALKQRLDDAAADTKAVRKVDMAKPQMAASLEPVRVKTERILPAPPPAPPSPPVEVVPEEMPTPVPQPPTRKRYAAAVVAPVERNICTRHNLRKVVTRGGKSWRCMR